MSRWQRTTTEALGIGREWQHVLPPLAEGVVGNKRYLVHLMRVGKGRVCVAISRLDYVERRQPRTGGPWERPYDFSRVEDELWAKVVWQGRNRMAGTQALLEDFEKALASPESRLMGEAL